MSAVSDKEFKRKWDRDGRYETMVENVQWTASSTLSTPRKLRTKMDGMEEWNYSVLKEMERRQFN